MLPVTAGDGPNQRAGASLWARVPAAGTTLIGRQREISQVRQLTAAHRLVRLTGPGGCGKTRLAMAAALDLDGDRHRWTGSVWRRIPILALVLPVVAASLGLRSQPRNSELDAITGVLSAWPAHLVLDQVSTWLTSSSTRAMA